ncbi:hypothetical protein AB0C02_28015 [Micromonospora sp. NPDC048999]|uniref:hypothetical protein n=1 Tax=Micromonospora sp. NPDC048999 TaxID=3155391 RepID=UPI0033DFE0B2
MADTPTATDLMRKASDTMRLDTDERWHAVAAWLDDLLRTTADYVDDEPCRGNCWHSVCAVNRGAHTVARAYLSDEAEG